MLLDVTAVYQTSKSHSCSIYLFDFIAKVCDSISLHVNF